MRGGRLREVVTKGGSTVCQRTRQQKKEVRVCQSARILSPGSVSKQPLKVASIDHKTEDSE